MGKRKLGGKRVSGEKRRESRVGGGFGGVSPRRPYCLIDNETGCDCDGQKASKLA